MRPSHILQNVLLGTSALLYAGTNFVPGHDETGPVLASAISFVNGTPAASDSSDVAADVESKTRTALEALKSAVRPLSHPRALEDAFTSYFAFKAAKPDEVKKPYLYFVDYGLPSTTPRGYLFDMASLRIVDGPFTVAHGRGSSTSRYGVPTRFSNRSGSNATSLGLYVAEALYSFHGHSGGRSYSSVGLRLDGVSSGFNDNAFDRGVVAHGAPYVTSDKAGRSEGCPAMEPARAKKLLPKLANGGLVFLFAPDSKWMENDPWVSGDAS